MPKPNHERFRVFQSEFFARRWKRKIRAAYSISLFHDSIFKERMDRAPRESNLIIFAPRLRSCFLFHSPGSLLSSCLLFTENCSVSKVKSRICSTHKKLIHFSLSFGNFGERARFSWILIRITTELSCTTVRSLSWPWRQLPRKERNYGVAPFPELARERVSPVLFSCMLFAYLGLF